MLMRWFAAGFAVSILLSTLLSDVFAAAKPSAADFRRDLNRAAKACGITQPEWNQCLDQSQSPRTHGAYMRFVDGGLERLTEELSSRGVTKLLFVASRYLNCEVSDEILRVHPDAVGLQILLADLLKTRSQGEVLPTEIRIETVPEEFLTQNVQKRVEMQGGALVLRAAFGSCSTLETKEPNAQETGARSVFLGFELGRKLFR